MRTTLTIDDRIARMLKALAHRTGKSFKQVLNETLEAGLAAREAPARGRRYRVKPASLGGVLPGIDLTKALRLAASLEDEEIARKLELRK
jgi:hypothetical protein